MPADWVDAYWYVVFISVNNSWFEYYSIYCLFSIFKPLLSNRIQPSVSLHQKIKRSEPGRSSAPVGTERELLTSYAMPSAQSMRHDLLDLPLIH